MADEIMTQSWMRQLGIADGARLAGQVLDELSDAETRERIDSVSLHTLAAIGRLAGDYRQRGVSEPLIGIWRTSCHEEMTRVFAEFRRVKMAVAA
jgi:hypothetical protein